MARNRRSACLIVLLSLLTGGLAVQVEARWKNLSRQRKQVRVYLPKEGDARDASSNPFNLHPVMRSVNSGAPMRPALLALLAGPTPREKRQGFQDHDVRGLYLVKVAIKDGGTAYASFAHRKSWAGWSGDLSPAAFRDGVERTLLQFPNVRRTVICVDGTENFYDESGAAEKKCPPF